MNHKPSRTLTIDDRRVSVYDDLLSQEEVDNFAAVVSGLNYQPRESFDRELSVGIPNDSFCRAPFLHPVTQGLFDDVAASDFEITDETVGLSHVYAAALNTSSCGSLHQDLESSQAVTFLYYANETWQGDWGGETVFYNYDRDAVYAVTPKPGRLVMFHSNLYHRAGVPHPDTPCLRYGVSMFYYPNKRALN